jgi:hypothetical protein
VAKLLELPLRFLRSSDLARARPELDSLGGNNLVLAVCRAAGADAYVSGTGCLDFIQPEAFEREGVRFYFQRFTHPTYSQVGSNAFVSHLSVLDALFNAGVAGTRAMICQRTEDRAIEQATGAR